MKVTDPIDACKREELDARAWPVSPNGLTAELEANPDAGELGRRLRDAHNAEVRLGSILLGYGVRRMETRDRAGDRSSNWTATVWNNRGARSARGLTPELAIEALIELLKSELRAKGHRYAMLAARALEGLRYQAFLRPHQVLARRRRAAIEAARAAGAASRFAARRCRGARRTARRAPRRAVRTAIRVTRSGRDGPPSPSDGPAAPARGGVLRGTP